MTSASPEVKVGGATRLLFVDLMPIRYDPDTPYHSPLGGTQSAVAYLLPHLVELGFDVTLACRCGEAKVVRGVRCAPIESVSDAQRVLCDLGPDMIVSISDPFILLLTWLAWGAARRSNDEPPALSACTCGGSRCRAAARMLWIQHDTNVGALREVMPLLASSCDYYAFVSEWQREKFCAEFGVPTTCTAVLRNGVSPAFEGAARALSSHGPGASALAANQPPRMAYTSTPFRGLSVLIDLFPRIRAEIPDAELDVFSSMALYQFRDPPLFEALYERARAIPGVNLRGPVGQEQLSTALSLTDVLAYPNYFPETSCISVMEAAAAGCEVVTSDLGALKETLTHALGPDHTGAFDALPFACQRTFEKPDEYTQHLVTAEEMGEAYSSAFVASVVRRLRAAMAGRGDAKAEQDRAQRAGTVAERSGYASIALHWVASIRAALALASGRRLRGLGMHLHQLLDIAIAADREKNLPLVRLANELAIRSLPPPTLPLERASAEDVLAIRWIQTSAHLNAGVGFFMEGESGAAAAARHMQDASEIAIQTTRAYTAGRGTFLDKIRENGFVACRNLFLMQTGEEKTRSGERALDLRFDPSLAEVLARHYMENNQLGRAAGLYSQILVATASPRFQAASHDSIAALLKALMDHDSAELHLKKAFEVSAPGGPDALLILSNMVLNRCYHEDEDASNPIIRAYAEEWGRLFAPSSGEPAQPDANRPAPGTEIRVGYFASDFRAHPVGTMLGVLLRHHNPATFTLYCYNATPTEKRDPISPLFAACPNVTFRDVYGKSPEEIAAIIRADRLDVLIEMMGHVALSRMDALRGRIARVIASFFAFPATTGIPAVQWKLVDGYVCPEGCPEEAFYTERLYRLPHLQCYEPWPSQRAEMRVAKRVEPYEASPRRVRFGNFNNPHKFTRASVRAWAEILRRVPESSLSMRFFLLQDPLIRARITEAFGELGVAEDRLDFGYARTIGDYFDAYNEIDIALDTFPYNGGITSSEALWYSTPLIAKAGSSYRSRVGAALLSALGHPELIARTDDEYINIAVALANNPGRLRAYHEGLHAAMLRSPLGDGALYTAGFEAAILRLAAG